MTLQIAEKLIYKDVEFYIGTYPLETYLAEKQICFNWESSTCWRGYYGTWLIEDDKLFLIDLSATIIKDYGMWKWPFEYVEVGLDYLFPNQDKVFAEWFSGKIHLPYGNMIPSYFRIYEKNIVLEFVSGKLVASHIEDNTHLYNEKKETDDLPF